MIALMMRIARTATVLPAISRRDVRERTVADMVASPGQDNHRTSPVTAGIVRRHAMARPSLSAARAMAFAVAVACTGHDDGDLVSLRIAVGTEPATLDPWRVTNTLEASIVSHVAETLVRLDSTGTIVPGLASSWSISPDSRTVMFVLRDGVTFHDGSPFTAEAVRWNLDRLTRTNMQTYGRAPDPYSAIDSVVAPDRSTVRISLRVPAADRLLAELSTAHTAIIAPASVDRPGNSFERIELLVGTGPFRFVGRVPGQRLSLRRFHGYYGGDALVDSLEFLFEPSDSLRAEAVKTGAAHVAVLPALASARRLVQQNGLTLTYAATQRAVFLGLSTRRPPLDDPRVRRALNHAVDVRRVMADLLGGAADAMEGVIPPTIEGSCRPPAYEYDVATARRLLREAGVRPGTRLEIIAPRGRYLRDDAIPAAVAPYLRTVGFDVTIRVIENWDTYLAAIRETATNGTAQAHVFGWAPFVPTAAAHLEVFSSELWPPYGPATAFYANARVDSLLNAVRTEPDAERRTRAACAAATIVWEDAPWLFLWRQRYPVLQAAGINGLSVLPGELLTLTRVSRAR
jgi:peptide/nickel transport system substrate-binding protein